MKQIIKFIKLNYKFFIEEFIKVVLIVFTILFVGAIIANTDAISVVINKWLEWIGISVVIAIIALIISIINNKDDIEKMDL